MWWALIEEIALRSEEIACEKEMACCVRVYHVYEDMLAAAIGESAGVSLLVCRCWCVVVGKIFIVKLYLHKIFSYVFCVRTFFTMNSITQFSHFFKETNQISQ